MRSQPPKACNALIHAFTSTPFQQGTHHEDGPDEPEGELDHAGGDAVVVVEGGRAGDAAVAVAVGHEEHAAHLGRLGEAHHAEDLERAQDAVCGRRCVCRFRWGAVNTGVKA